MKKLKTIAAAIVRAALLLSPGIAFAKLDSLINILAAVGLETLFLLVIVFISVITPAVKATKKDDRENEDATTEVE